MVSSPSKLVFALGVVGFLSGCGEEGYDMSAACRELPLYDVRAANRPNGSEINRLRAAVNAHCITPIGTALTDPNAPARPSSPSGGGAPGTGDAGAPDGG